MEVQHHEWYADALTFLVVSVPEATGKAERIIHQTGGDPSSHGSGGEKPVPVFLSYLIRISSPSYRRVW